MAILQDGTFGVAGPILAVALEINIFEWNPGTL